LCTITDLSYVPPVQGQSTIAEDPRVRPFGAWQGGAIHTEPGSAAAALRRLEAPLFVVRDERGALGLADSGHAELGAREVSHAATPLVAIAPALPARTLGDPTFCRAHAVRYAIVAGAMAGGIASAELVEAMARAGMLAFFGAAGLPAATVDAAIERLQTRLLDRPYGFNLIHSPYEPALEQQVAELYVRRSVRRVSASAYLDLTLPLLAYRFHGIHRDGEGRVVTPNRLVAKVSRVEVARKFLAPAPSGLLSQLVDRGDLTAEQAKLAALVPVAEDLTAEADSGGHTDNQSLMTLLPTMLELRDRLQSEHGFAQAPRIGAAGGMATPAAIAAAFAMGAAYVMTGSVNQACCEAGTSDHVRQLLAQAQQADTTMAPAADMFEMGVQLQVLRRGTLFPGRARKLWELYRTHHTLEEIEPSVRQQLEATFFRTSLGEVWAQTQDYWRQRDAAQVQRAEQDPHYRMALCFRWYLGQSSRWANHGEAGREADYQIWCGPSMGAFNAWTRETFLEDWTQRRVVVVNLNLLHAAAVATRAQILRAQGIALHPAVVDLRPRPLAELEEFAL
jgi:PfaD family protein